MVYTQKLFQGGVRIKHFTLNLPIQNRPTIGNNTNSIVGDFTAVNLLEVNVTQNMSFIERVKEITKKIDGGFRA